MAAPAGWYPDPGGSGGLRWFDGAGWTAHTHPAAPTVQQPAAPVRPAVPAQVPFWRRPIVLGVATAVLVAALGGWYLLGRSGSGSPATQPVSGPTATAGRPAVGDCHHYGFAAMQRPTEATRPIPCGSGRVTAMTVAVLPPPQGTLLPFDGHPAAVRAAGTACQVSLSRFLGGGPGIVVSRLSLAFFEPTHAQIAAGQRWVRCDVWLSGTGRGAHVLQPLPHGSVRGALRGPGAWTYALCIRTGPGRATFTTVGCAAPGAHVVVISVPVAAPGTPYPGPAAAATRATGACHLAARWYGGLALTGLAQPRLGWSGMAVCVTAPAAYRHWLAAGRPFGPPQHTT